MIKLSIDIPKKNPEIDKISLSMDIEFCHSGDCPLNLHALMQSKDMDFFHDIDGFYKHFNRSTKHLSMGFSPRHSQTNHPIK